MEFAIYQPDRWVPFIYTKNGAHMLELVRVAAQNRYAEECTIVDATQRCWEFRITSNRLVFLGKRS